MNPAKTPVKVTVKTRLLTAAEFQRLAEVPPEAEWFRNIRSPATKRAYENAVRDFMRFAGINRPEEFRNVTRAHVIAWRDDLGDRLLPGGEGLSGTTIRHRLAALSSLYQYLCDKNAVTHNPVKGVKRPRVETDEGKTPALGDHQARKLLKAPDEKSLKGIRDRAILARHARRPGDAPARDPMQEFANRIIAELENGVKPWVRPWDPEKAGGPQGPFNPVTGKRYHGINVLILGMDMRAFQTGDPRWMTYQQAQGKDWQVRKGERSTTIFFTKPYEVEDEAAEDGTKTIRVLKHYAVFHASQIDGIPAYKAPAVDEAPWTRPEASEIILRNSGAVVRIGGDRAFYSPSTDHIQLPPDFAFNGPEEFAATALHELAHWTGHPNRLNRNLQNRFGSAAYAMEELRAELASAFVANEIGIPTDIPHHASYFASWIKSLKDDKREIFRAAGDAQRIASMELGFHPDYAAQVQEELTATPS